ncbi:hypothetical protein U1Q18_014976 [Sarracenia purpurea var. burkii]
MSFPNTSLTQASGLGGKGTSIIEGLNGAAYPSVVSVFSLGISTSPSPLLHPGTTLFTVTKVYRDKWRRWSWIPSTYDFLEHLLILLHQLNPSSTSFSVDLVQSIYREDRPLRKQNIPTNGAKMMVQSFGQWSKRLSSSSLLAQI